MLEEKKVEKKRIDCVPRHQRKQDLKTNACLSLSLLTHSPLPTDICSWEYVSKVDVRGHQVWMVLSESIIGETLYTYKLNHICVCVFFFLTGCRFLFSLWFCSMAFKSRSPRSIFSVRKNQISLNIPFNVLKHLRNSFSMVPKSLTGSLHVLGGEAG